MRNNPSNGYAQWEIWWNETVNTAPLGYVDEWISVSVKENGPAREAVQVRRSKFNFKGRLTMIRTTLRKAILTVCMRS